MVDTIKILFTEYNFSLRHIGRIVGYSHQKVGRRLKSIGLDVPTKRIPKTLIDVKCSNCGKEFKRYRGILNGDTFCSSECYNKYRDYHKSSTCTKQLTNSVFVELRKQVLKRFPNCVLCGSVDKLHVHHIIPRRDDENLCNSLDNLITLCSSCHCRIKNNEYKYVTYFLGLIEKEGELLGTPNVKTRAISSQALEGIGSKEGSETTTVSPNNNPLQEFPPRKGRYSPNYMETYRSANKELHDNILGS